MSTDLTDTPASLREHPAFADLTLGAIGSILVCAGAFGVGDIPRNSAVLQDLGLTWMTYGHGKTLFGTVFWLGVATMVIAWVRLGRRITTEGGRGDRQTPVRVSQWGVIAWAAPLLVSVPIYSRDVYAYLGQGAVFIAGFNPYADGPAHHPGPLVDS